MIRYCGIRSHKHFYVCYGCGDNNPTSGWILNPPTTLTLCKSCYYIYRRPNRQRPFTSVLDYNRLPLKDKSLYVCYACGSNDTKRDKYGYATWRLNVPTDLVLCQSCYNRHIKPKPYHNNFHNRHRLHESLYICYGCGIDKSKYNGSWMLNLPTLLVLCFNCMGRYIYWKPHGQPRKVPWKRKQGGFLSSCGYMMVKAPLDHPNHSRNGGYIQEHRLIMEQHLGRHLSRSEIVHHINGIKTDNKIGNLELTNNKKHTLIHQLHYLSGRKCIRCGSNRTGQQKMINGRGVFGIRPNPRWHHFVVCDPCYRLDKRKKRKIANRLSPKLPNMSLFKYGFYV
jgi:hypothetical protein